MTLISWVTFVVLMALLGVYNYRRSKKVGRSLMALHPAWRAKSCRGAGTEGC